MDALDGHDKLSAMGFGIYGIRYVYLAITRAKSSRFTPSRMTIRRVTHTGDISKLCEALAVGLDRQLPLIEQGSPYQLRVTEVPKWEK